MEIQRQKIKESLIEYQLKKQYFIARRVNQQGVINKTRQISLKKAKQGLISLHLFHNSDQTAASIYLKTTQEKNGENTVKKEINKQGLSRIFGFPQVDDQNTLLQSVFDHQQGQLKQILLYYEDYEDQRVDVDKKQFYEANFQQSLNYLEDIKKKFEFTFLKVVEIDRFSKIKAKKIIETFTEKEQSINAFDKQFLDMKFLSEEQLFSKQGDVFKKKEVQMELSDKRKNQLLGGGCGFSKDKVDVIHPQQTGNIRNNRDDEILKQKELNEQDILLLKKEFVIGEEDQEKDDQSNKDQNSDENYQLDDLADFNNYYKKFYNSHQPKLSSTETQVRLIIEQSIYQFREALIDQNRSRVIDLINLVINYLLIIIQNKLTYSMEKDLERINQYLKELKDYCYENRKRYPSLELYQYFDFLLSLNSQRKGLDIVNQSTAYKVFKIILKVVKFGAGFVSIAGAIQNLANLKFDDIDKLKKEAMEIFNQVKAPIQDIAQEGLQQYNNYNQGKISDKIITLWQRKIQSIGDDLFKIYEASADINKIQDESQILDIFFYLQEISEMDNKDSQDIILFVFMQLNYLLAKQKEKDTNFKLFSQKLKDKNKESLVFKFINLLQLNKYDNGILDSIKNFANFIATSEQFRYLKTLLLLNFAQIVQNLDNVEEYHKIMIHLCTKYLQEKEISVRIVYKGNQQVAQFIHKKEYYDEILKESKRLKEEYKKATNQDEVQSVTNKIETEEDILKLIAKNFAEMWEVSVKQRQDQNKIAHKDDALLEALNLYIKQKLTYEQGFNFLKINNQSQQEQESDAIKIIIENFLIPNYQKLQNKIQQQQDKQQIGENIFPCKILSILAEGGSGKSMLLKKLEVELLKEQGDSEYRKDENSNYLPFIIKCSSLDQNNPSIENYLKLQKLDISDIELLKKSEKNKLILLDGFDEYAGDYFKVYQVLNLYEWVNTLVIITSRLDKISISDAKIYFNYYDQQGNQGSNDSFAIFMLNKINESDIQQYLTLFKDQQEKKTDFNLDNFNKIKSTLLKNHQLTELLKLPINLYLTTRMINDLDLSDKNIFKEFQQASDQVDIQELFFSQQFKKQSQIFVEQLLNVKENKKQELIQKVQLSYFEYFQFIAMHMFIQKGKINSNFLSTTKECIKNFSLQKELQGYFENNSININDLIQKLSNYVDSRVITRVQLALDNDNDDDQLQKFEFRHKSLFEYFAARAMKYDFDQYQEDIFKKDISVLSQFNINKKIIMSQNKNESEQQILLKLYKLIKADVESENFRQSYSQQDISLTNRYIQYLKKSSISKSNQISKIDIGASNLLSALFISKFSYPKLIFKKCSFSKAYISSYSRKLADFQDCNFENAFLEQQHLEYFETSNTKNAMLSAFQKYFDIDDIYQFNQVIFYQNTLVTITQSGFINQFSIQNPEFNKIQQTNQITKAPLKSIYLESSKGIFVIRAEKSLFEVDPKSFEIINSFSFIHLINSLQLYKSKYIVHLINDQIFYGDIQSGFTQLGPSKNKETKIYNLFQIIKNIKYEQNISSSSPDSGQQAIIGSVNNQNIQTMELGQNQFLFQGQINPINTVAFSADGKYLAIASQDSTCQIWDVEQGQLQYKISGHSKFIDSIQFSADGKFLATGSKDNTCKIWNIKQGYELVHTIQEHSLPIKSIAFSADSKYIATGSEDNICKILNIEKEYEILHSIQGHTDSILSVAFSPDSKYAATGSDDQTCKIWDIETRQIISTLQGHNGSIIQIAFCNDGKYLATCSKDKNCKIWNTQKKFELIITIQGHTNWINSLAFSPDSKYLATVSKDNTCKVWDVDQGFELKHNIEAHNNWINAVAFSADSKYIVTGSKDNTCKIWDIYNGFTHIHTIEGHKSPIQTVTFSANRKYLVTGSSDCTCKVWNIEKNYELVCNIEGHKSSIKSVAFSADCKYLATGSSDSTCNIWNVEKQFEIINTIKGHTNLINSVAFSPNSKYIATASLDNTFKLWNIQIGFEYLNIMQGHKSSICSIAISADSKYLATSSQDKTCKIWNTQKGFQLIAQIKGHSKLIKSVAFSADGRYLATGSWDKTCKIWNIEQGYQLIYSIEGQTEEIQSISFSRDCKYLACGSSDFVCRIWNIENGFKLQQQIQGHTDKLRSVVFSVDGKYLATGSEDNTCKIWDVQNGFELIKTVEGHTNSIASLAFSFDGKYLATGSYDNSCKIWNVLNKFQLVFTIQGHSQFISSISFSAGDKFLATASDDQTCKIWDVENEFKLVNNVQGHTLAVNSVIFSAIGQYFATGSDDNSCKIWSFEQKGQVLNEDANNIYQIYEL